MLVAFATCMRAVPGQHHRLGKLQALVYQPSGYGF